MRTLALALVALFVATASFAAPDVYPIISPTINRAVSGQPFNIWVYVNSCCGEQVQGGRLTLNLPPELGLTAGPRCTTSGNVAECELPALWSGNAITVEMHGRAQVESTRTVTITATYTPQVPDQNPTNNTVSKDILVLAEPDLSVSLRHELQPNTLVFAGGSTDFAVSVSNLGSEARDLHLRLLPHGAEIGAILANGWDCSASGPDSADCIRTSLPYGWGGEVAVNLRPLGTGASQARLDVELTSAGPDYSSGNDRASIAFDVYRSIAVENTADSGPGSLRAAIETANAECTSGPCQIRFALPRRDDWYTIEPRTPLPAITADGLVFDARTQPGWVALNPRIALDGHLLASGDGLVLSSPCSFRVIGFAIGNFPGNGIATDSAQTCSGGQKRIEENRIGTDPTGEYAWPNTRGILAAGKGIVMVNNVVGGNRRSGIVVDGERITVERNIIGGLVPNGASGIYVAGRASNSSIAQNVIADNLDMGVAIATEARGIDVRINRMLRNAGLGIDIGLDGRSSPVPQILAITPLNNGYTSVTLSVREDGPFRLDLYSNEGPDGEGELWVNQAFLPRGDGTPFEVQIPGTYFSGKWINATSTPQRGTTSELSDAVAVP